MSTANNRGPKRKSTGADSQKGKNPKSQDVTDSDMPCAVAKQITTWYLVNDIIFVSLDMCTEYLMNICSVRRVRGFIIGTKRRLCRLVALTSTF